MATWSRQKWCDDVDEMCAAKLLTSTDARVLRALSKYARRTTGRCWPTQATVAAAAGVSRPTVQRTYARAVGLGILHVVRRGNTFRDGNRGTEYLLIRAGRSVFSPHHPCGGETPPAEGKESCCPHIIRDDRSIGTPNATDAAGLKTTSAGDAEAPQDLTHVAREAPRPSTVTRGVDSDSAITRGAQTTRMESSWGA